MSSVHLKDYKVPNFLIPEIHLEFDLSPNETLVTNSMKIVKNPNSQQGEDLFLQGENLTLLEAQLDGQPIDKKNIDISDSGLTIKNCPPSGTLEIKTKIDPEKNKTFSGLYKTKNMYCTQMEAEGFRTVTYFADRPDVLSIYTTTIRGPKDTCPTLLSNGYVFEEKDLSNGQHQVIWKDPFPKPSYLFALVAGDFDCMSDSFETKSKKRVDLNIYVDKGKAHRAKHAMRSLKQSMLWDEKTYDLEYDLPLYNIVAVDDFNMGAMENKGLNIFNSKYVLADQESATDEEYVGILRVIGHEYFHNWSGNRVTCRDWFQLSLKEGLTVYRDQEFTCDLTNRQVKRIEDVALLRNRQFPEDSGPLAHPVRPASYQSIDNFYTMTVYHKGAEVIRMLASLLGETLYKKGVSLYFKKFDGHAATIENFIQCMEEASGQNFNQFKLWYDQPGTPEVNVTHSYDKQSGELQIDVQQSLQHPINQKQLKPMHFPLKLGLIGPDGESLQFSFGNDKDLMDELQLEIKEASESFKIKNVSKKPVLSLLRDFSAPVRLKYEASEADLHQQLRFDTNGFTRWEAGQKLIMNGVLSLYSQSSALATPQVSENLIESFRKTLGEGAKSPALVGQLLQLPSRHYISQFISPFDPLKLEMAIYSFKKSLTNQLKDIFLENYQTLLEMEKRSSSQDEMFVRRLKNTCLNYLATCKDEQTNSLVKNQFSESKNMTDQLSCLVCASYNDLQCFDELFDPFFAKWQDDALVLNKWFYARAIRRSKTALTEIKEIVTLPHFDRTNPNNLYSLINTFAHENWYGFYQAADKAVSWFSHFVEEIDQANPIVAARLGTSLNIWKDLTPEYSSLLKGELQRLSKSNLSKNLGEIVHKGLQ